MPAIRPDARNAQLPDVVDAIRRELELGDRPLVAESGLSFPRFFDDLNDRYSEKQTL